MLQESQQDKHIYTEGCVDGGEKWLNKNLVPVAGALVAVALVQVRVRSAASIVNFSWYTYTINIVTSL